MFIELHMIQNFAPSCLNRDDTNSPKDCIFGGARRARISSQCIKRAIRAQARVAPLLEGHLAIRTKRLRDRVVEMLVKEGKPEDASVTVATSAIQAVGFNVKDDGKTDYLVFLGEPEIQELKKQILAKWDELAVLTPASAPDSDSEKKADKKKGKKDKKGAMPAELQKAFKHVMEGNTAADLALFGRMLADMPDRNVNAACQVAHALSTHKVEMEMDFFTAVDDLKPDDSSGADMMGTVEFNSACFYRYALVDWDLLVRNLGGDEELARATLEAFLHASIEAIPTGKQNTFAAHNPPSFVMAAVREKGTPWSLANAFEAPVRANNEGLVKASIERLDQYWGRLSKMYGSPVRALAWAALDEAITCPNIGPAAETVGRLIETTMAAATPAGREVAP